MMIRRGVYGNCFITQFCAAKSLRSGYGSSGWTWWAPAWIWIGPLGSCELTVKVI